MVSWGLATCGVSAIFQHNTLCCVTAQRLRVTCTSHDGPATRQLSAARKWRKNGNSLEKSIFFLFLPLSQLGALSIWFSIFSPFPAFGRFSMPCQPGMIPRQEIVNKLPRLVLTLRSQKSLAKLFFWGPFWGYFKTMKRPLWGTLRGYLFKLKNHLKIPSAQKLWRNESLIILSRNDYASFARSGQI